MTIALYTRLSPKPNGKYEGVDDQITWGTTYAANAWPGEPIEVFADRGISAANGDHRPDFERLREWVRAGRITRVWAVEQSRLTRDEIEWFNLRADLIGADITEVHTNRDGVVKVMDAVAGIKAVINADERRKMLRRQADTLAEKAARGEPAGVRPFGYVHGFKEDGTTRTYHVVPEQAAVIRYAADKALSGWSLASIAAAMNKPADERDPELVPVSGDLAEEWKDGVRGVHGGKITPGAVKNWLTVPTIAGLRQHSGEIVGDGNWPAILDRATHRTLKARLTGERAVKRGQWRYLRDRLRPQGLRWPQVPPDWRSGRLRLRPRRRHEVRYAPHRYADPPPASEGRDHAARQALLDVPPEERRQRPLGDHAPGGRGARGQGDVHAPRQPRVPGGSRRRGRP